MHTVRARERERQKNVIIIFLNFLFFFSIINTILLRTCIAFASGTHYCFCRRIRLLQSAIAAPAVAAIQKWRTQCIWAIFAYLNSFSSLAKCMHSLLFHAVMFRCQLPYFMRIGCACERVLWELHFENHCLL